MKVVFKSFRADARNLFHHIAESDAFRVTGDCSVHNSKFKD